MNKAESACVAYAIARMEAKRLTKIMADSRCARIVAWCDTEEAAYDPSYAPDSLGPRPDTCVTEHWMDYGQSKGSECPLEECCPACQAVIAAVAERRFWRAKLGAAKRVILALGKSLNAHTFEESK